MAKPPGDQERRTLRIRRHRDDRLDRIGQQLCRAPLRRKTVPDGRDAKRTGSEAEPGPVCTCPSLPDCEHLTNRERTSTAQRNLCNRTTRRYPAYDGAAI